MSLSVAVTAASIVAEILSAAEELTPAIEGLAPIIAKLFDGGPSAITSDDLTTLQALATTLNAAVAELEAEHGGS